MKFTGKQIGLSSAAIVVLAFAVLSLFANKASFSLPQTGQPLSAPKSTESVVTKVIDGDTVVVEGGDHVRLLGMDADEKGYPCYDAARLRLEELVLSKTVKLESDAQDKDQYGRLLRYIFYNGENINKQLVAEGLAVARFYPENQKYKDEVTAAEAAAIKNNTGCKWNGQSQIASVVIVPPSNQNLKWEKLAGVAVDACDAKNHLNEDAIVQGYVASASKSTSDTVFLNFDKAYPGNCFTAVIFKSALGKFSSPKSLYDKKTVRIKGKITEYQGKPEIILNDPLLIEIGI
jgi:micrococcal nuclease